MMTFMFTLSTTLSMLFMMMNHPLSAGLILLIQTVIISLITGNLSYKFWFSYILYLILIKGMLILFMYMTSIASNEKFKTSPIMMLSLIPTPLILWMFISMNAYTQNNKIFSMTEQTSINVSLNKYIYMPLSMTLIFMMIYLLLVLIATVKITSFKQSSIRQMN